MRTCPSCMQKWLLSDYATADGNTGMGTSILTNSQPEPTPRKTPIRTATRSPPPSAHRPPVAVPYPAHTLKTPKTSTIHRSSATPSPPSPPLAADPPPLPPLPLDAVVNVMLKSPITSPRMFGASPRLTRSSRHVSPRPGTASGVRMYNWISQGALAPDGTPITLNDLANFRFGSGGVPVEQTLHLETLSSTVSAVLSLPLGPSL